MSEANERAAAFEAELIRNVASCGVDPSHISLRYEDSLQDYDLIVSGGALSAECIACIANAVGDSALLSFTAAANAAELLEISILKTRQMLRQVLREKAKSMPDLPRFDRTAMTLAAFARELEAYCDIEPGTALDVFEGKMLTIRPTLSLEPGGLQRYGRLMEVVSVALIDHDDIRFGVFGGT